MPAVRGRNRHLPAGLEDVSPLPSHGLPHHRQVGLRQDQGPLGVLGGKGPQKKLIAAAAGLDKVSGKHCGPAGGRWFAPRWSRW